MLLEKFDPQLVKPLPSPFITTPKLAPLSSRSHSTTGAEMPDLSQFRRARKNSANIRQEKSILIPEENVTIRPPKIYAGSLPEVFRTDLSFSRQPSRQLSKGNEDIRDSSSGPENSKPRLKKEISMDVAREGNCFVSPMKVQVRTHRTMRKILTVANSREPTPLQTPECDERILKPLFNLDMDKKNIFQTNLKPNPPPLTVLPSQNSKKLANIIRLNLKPFAENIEPNTRRSEKSFMIKKIFGKLDQQQNLDLSIDEMRYHLPRNRAMTNSAMHVTLNELITLKKIKPTSNNGILKRVLHAPSFQIFDVQEEPISVAETSHLKDWLESWKINLSHDKYLARVYSCFWNAPEGCISVLLEPSKKGFLSDLIHNFGSLPEICLREVARTVGKGLSHIQYSLQKSHGNISPNEVIITSRDTFKLGPGIYSRDPNFQVSTRLRSQKSKEFLPILSESKSQASLSLETLTKPYSQDIFDLGFMLLQCALGDLTLYDSSNLFSLKNIKTALDHPALKRALKKDVCCFLHNEELMRDILKLLPEMSAPSVHGKILQNNFHAKDDYKEFYSSNAPSHVSLLELLTLGDRFSKLFLDFLCCCLRLDSTKRPNIHNLLSHEFLNSTESHGPLVNLSELLKMEIKDTNCLEGECAEGMAEKHLDKFIDALRLAFLDQDMKIKFDSIVHLHRKTESTEKKIADLAHELGLLPTKLSEKLSDKLNESWSP